MVVEVVDDLVWAQSTVLVIVAGLLLTWSVWELLGLLIHHRVPWPPARRIGAAAVATTPRPTPTPKNPLKPHHLVQIFR